MKWSTCGLLLSLTALSAGTSPLAQPTTQPRPEETKTSLWGNAVNGVQGRARLPAQIEQNAPLDVSFEIQCDPDHLLAGVSRLDTACLPLFVRLVLTDVSTAKQLELQPYDPATPSWHHDHGNSFVTLDGKAIPPLRVSFPLLNTAVKPGLYDGVVSYCLEGSTPGWIDLRKVKPSFWAGSFSSAVVRIRIIPETPKTKTLFVPKRLRIEGHLVVFGKADAEEVKPPIRNGYFLATSIAAPGGGMLQGGCWDQPGKMVTIDDLEGGVNRTEGLRTLIYAITIFETAQQPEHMWHPAPGADGYKVLWKNTFTVERK